jgi:hypothetical protein
LASSSALISAKAGPAVKSATLDAAKTRNLVLVVIIIEFSWNMNYNPLR